MPNIESKQIKVDEIKEKIKGATSIVLVDARGITVGDDTILRKSLREAGVVYKTYKNSLINFAIKDTEFEGLGDFLSGPTTIAVCYEDPTIAAAILSKAAKEFKAIEFKGGIIDGSLYNADAMKIIAEIPSREVLLAKLLGSFKSPLSSFARVIKAIADKDVA